MGRVPRLLAASVVASLCACGDGRKELGQARTEPGGVKDGGAAAPVARDAGDDPVVDPVTPPAPDDEPVTVGAPAGAIPAWQAVVDRDRYLARRNQRGVITGRVGGDAIAPGAKGAVRWLIDETEGNGALAVRLGITGKVPAEGDRVAVTGAWAVDDQRRWYWQVESIEPLAGPPPAASPDPPGVPGHQIASGPVPKPYRAASRPLDGGVIVFGVIRTPPGDGDGWLIGDDSFGAPAAQLFLPGERPSYGGHDLRQDDERWVLKRAVNYWVRIERVRKRTPDSLPTIRAVSAPVKLQ